jgi:hypothetical protein
MLNYHFLNIRLIFLLIAESQYFNRNDLGIIGQNHIASSQLL